MTPDVQNWTSTAGTLLIYRKYSPFKADTIDKKPQEGLKEMGKAHCSLFFPINVTLISSPKGILVLFGQIKFYIFDAISNLTKIDFVLFNSPCIATII